MDGCSTCFGSKKSLDERLITALKKAKEKAVAEAKAIAIVVDENGEYVLYDAFYAYKNGMAQAVKSVVSHL